MKMSKSNPNPATRILLTDPPDVVAKKIAGAVTDSTPEVTYDPATRPGISNLLSIYAGLTSTTPEAIAAELRGQMAAELKRRLTDVVVDALSGFRTEFARLRKDPGYVDEVEARGRRTAAEAADATLSRAKHAMGLG